MATLGATLERVTPGAVSIRLPFRDDLTQQHGSLHAGAIAAILDSACGYAALSLMAPGMAVLSVEFKINLLAPAEGTEFVARANVIRPGKTLTVCNGEVVALGAGGEIVVAAMQSTMMALPEREGREN